MAKETLSGSRESIKPSIVIVTMDIQDDQRCAAFEKFMLEELNAEQMSDTTFEFDYSKGKINFRALRRKIEMMIEIETDIVYLWDIDRLIGTTERFLFRTKIG